MQKPRPWRLCEKDQASVIVQQPRKNKTFISVSQIGKLRPRVSPQVEEGAQV